MMSSLSAIALATKMDACSMNLVPFLRKLPIQLCRTNATATLAGDLELSESSLVKSHVGSLYPTRLVVLE